MLNLSRFLKATTLAAALLLPSATFAARTISVKTAKAYISQAATQDAGKWGAGWKVTFGRGSNQYSRKFFTSPKWQGPPPRFVMMPRWPKGQIDMTRSAKSPKGLDRVQIYPRALPLH